MDDASPLRLLELKARRRQASRQLERQRRRSVLVLLVLTALLLAFAWPRADPEPGAPAVDQAATRAALASLGLGLDGKVALEHGFPAQFPSLFPIPIVKTPAHKLARKLGHCPIPHRFQNHFVRASTLHRVPLPLLTAVAYAESRFKPQARSHAGAIGLFQLMPETARGMHIDPYQPRLNIAAGAKYLHGLLIRFHGNKRLAVAAYNAGPNAVAHYGGVPPYHETQYYVHEVLNQMAYYDGRLRPCRAG